MSAITGIPSPTVEIPFAIAATYAFFRGVDHGAASVAASRERRSKKCAWGERRCSPPVRARPAGAWLQGRPRLPGHARRNRMVSLSRLRAHCCNPSRRMTRTAIIAAMPGELNPLSKTPVGTGRTASGTASSFWAQRNAEDEWIAACAGAGQAAATRAFAALEDGGPIDLIFQSAGPELCEVKFCAARRTIWPA